MARGMARIRDVGDRALLRLSSRTRTQRQELVPAPIARKSNDARARRDAFAVEVQTSHPSFLSVRHRDRNGDGEGRRASRELPPLAQLNMAVRRTGPNVKSLLGIALRFRASGSPSYMDRSAWLAMETHNSTPFCASRTNLMFLQVLQRLLFIYPTASLATPISVDRI